MNRLKQRYGSPVLICFFGEFLTGITGAMLAPFLLFYLYDVLGTGILPVMLVIGARPLTEVAVTLVAGGLTDRIGRRKVILTALAFQTVSAAGFMMADHIWLFALFYVLNGIGGALYIPAQRAQITDSTESGRRSEAFAVLHAIEGLGAAVGPAAGLAVYSYQPSLMFGFQACAFFLYWLAVYFKMPEVWRSKRQKEILERKKLLSAKKVFFQHRPVLSLMFLSVPVSLFYAQLESNYRLYLETLFEDFLFILTVYTVCRALLSITMQIPLVKWTEGLNIQTVVSISYVCYAVAAIGFAFSSSIFWLLSTAVLFTAAESMLLNHMQTFVSRLAPDHMRGRYFAFFGLHWDISRTIGPFLGGMMFIKFGGAALFLAIAGIVAAGGIAQYRTVLTLSSRLRKN
ncbi:MDR family MFS transporter [Bacillus paralicheniformis]|uniref:MDR family MFS transporter n=1 Tax=Bacillus paralicheniformis TaxID=1648923 RepID=UPI002282DF37|nr:MFS transporter [Bacillus paralicheniformis]MCY8150191.1 MFS transporter [Bacillus paralicheniformis]MCY8180348.1 MFS transporter [Bacillus paralicheniformis]MCY9422636.1 MFS transporter [Bacillus paralicheniformis]MEC0577395.1 MFS transporter [Bacillus paralicheniformis]